MNRQLFVDYIKSPQKLNAESIHKLESLVRDFPYCQTAGTLYTLNLYKENSIKYNNSLKMSAAYMADRILLKQLINSIEQTQNAASIISQKELKEDETEKKVIPVYEESFFEEMDIKEMIELLRNKIKVAEQSDISTDQKKKLPFIAAKLNEIIDKYSPVETEADDRPLKKKVKTQYAFDHLEEVQSDQNGTRKNQDLIDKFIEDKPRISPPSKSDFFNPLDLAKHSIIDNEEIVSETLANIYYQQGNLLKAINIYKKLSLLNPEKSIYFAALIEKIRNEVK